MRINEALDEGDVFLQEELAIESGEHAPRLLDRLQHDSIRILFGDEHAKKAANFVQSEVLRHAKTDGLSAELPQTPERIAALLGLEQEGTLSGKGVKQVFAEMMSNGGERIALTPRPIKNS